MGHVLDEKTALILVRFLNAKVLKSVDYPISTGKEAVVFRATAPDGRNLAVKVYKYETTSFRHMERYIEGDPRFANVKKQLRPLIREWAAKEFANLHKAASAGVRVPQPVAHRENVVLMNFEGEGGLPYPLLKDVELENPAKTFKAIVAEAKKLYEVGLVHGDLSEYNVLIDTDGKPIIIDVGQAVMLAHPYAGDFLRKDCHNIAHYFAGLGVKTTAEQVYADVTGK